MKRSWLIFIGTMILGHGAGAIQVTPTYQIFTVEPGQKVQGESLLLNNEGEDITIELSSKDWFVLTENQAFKAKDWLTFPVTKIAIPKGESKKINFTVEVPKKAQGELVGMMSYAILTETPSNIQKVLSVAIYATAARTEKMKGKLKDIMITPSSATFGVGILVVNEGNLHIRPDGFCEIKNDKGQIVANVQIDQGKPIYPGKESVCSGSVRNLVLKPGVYSAAIRITDIDRKVDVIKATKKFELLENNSIDIIK